MSNSFYIRGYSYTGTIVPVIAQLISNGNEEGIRPWINIKGYLLGNPLTFPDEANYRIPYAHRMGLISDELYKSLEQNCGGNYKNVDTGNLPFSRDVQNFRYLQCLQDLQTFHHLVNDLFDEHIIEPDCTTPGKIKYFGESSTLGDGQHTKLECYISRHKFLSHRASDPRAQESLHIREGSEGLWEQCNKSLHYTEVRWDATPYHANLSATGYRSLIYNGDPEMVIPHLSTQAWIRSLNDPIIEEWRQWLVEGQLAGYTRTYANNMTFATIKGGAHIPAEGHPKESLTVFKRWI